MDHAEECKAKNPETFAKIDKAITTCQDKLGAAISAFTSAIKILEAKASSMSAEVVAEVSMAYAKCVALLMEGKKSFDNAVSEAKSKFPEMYAEAKSDASEAVTEASTSLADAQAQVEAAVKSATS